MATEVIKILFFEENKSDNNLTLKMLRKVGADTSVLESSEQRKATLRLSATQLPQLQLIQVGTLAEAISVLAAESIDVILWDLSLTPTQSLETVTQLRSLVPEVAIVVISNLEDEAIALQAVKIGAQDYLVKGETTAQMLRRTLLCAIERQQQRFDKSPEIPLSTVKEITLRQQPEQAQTAHQSTEKSEGRLPRLGTSGGFLGSELSKRSESSLQKQSQTLMQLARSKTLQSNLNAALREITEASARTLGVERVSVW